jgi:hypothetical protein
VAVHAEVQPHAGYLQVVYEDFADIVQYLRSQMVCQVVCVSSVYTSSDKFPTT